VLDCGQLGAPARYRLAGGAMLSERADHNHTDIGHSKSMADGGAHSLWLSADGALADDGLVPHSITF
jgi:hypothetical protein